MRTGPSRFVGCTIRKCPRLGTYCAKLKAQLERSRVNMTVSDHTITLIGALEIKLEAETMTEVIRRAGNMLFDLLQRRDQGTQVFLRSPSNEETDLFEMIPSLIVEVKSLRCSHRLHLVLMPKVLKNLEAIAKRFCDGNLSLAIRLSIAFRHQIHVCEERGGCVVLQEKDGPKLPVRFF